MKQAVVVVNPYSSGALYAPRLRAAGFAVIGVLTTERPPAIWVDSYAPEQLDEVWIATDDAGLVRVADALRDRLVRCVVPGSEGGVWAADRLSQLLTPELCNDPALSAARRHKGAMQEALRAAGIPVGDFRTCRTADDVERWLADRESKTFVLKPALSAGTDNVTVLAPGDDWRAAWDRCHGQLNVLELRNDELVVQEFLEGTEWVVDAFSSPAGHSVTDIVRYGKRPGPNGSPRYDSLEFVAPDRAREEGLIDFAGAVLDAVGMRFGPAHLEIIVTADGPRLVEVGARIVGGGLPVAAAEATGEGPVRRLVRQLVEPGPPDEYRLLVPTAIVFVRIDEVGVIDDLSQLLSVRELASYWWDHIELEAGQPVAPASSLFDSVHHGTIGLRNADPDQLHRDVARVRELERNLVRPDRRPSKHPPTTENST